MQSWPRQLLLCLMLPLVACASRRGPATVASRTACENPHAIVVGTGHPLTRDDLTALRDSLVRSDLLAPTDSAQPVASGVAPRLENQRDIEKLLTANYPSDLRVPGTKSVVLVALLIDADGHVARTRVAQSSGSVRLDSGAMNVVRAMSFAPALYEGCRVRAGVRLPIVFATAAGTRVSGR